LQIDIVAINNFNLNVAHTTTTPSERTKNNKKMMLSSAGVDPAAGNDTFTRPE
jgi:hypothetical protein